MASPRALLTEIARCELCAEHLPHGIRPVLQVDSRARVLVAGQAPGRRVHESGIPFDDPSGDRLREWMGIERSEFHDATKIAIVPMGFCYPGSRRSGDLPPRRECAPAWRRRVLAELPRIELTLVVGRYALDYHLPRARASVTEAVRGWRDHWPHLLPLPHPSPRNRPWLRRHPWFEKEVVPALRSRVRSLLSSD